MNYENLISIVMPVFNAQAYLEEALESVRRQTWTDWELLVVDDHSTDGSAGLAAGRTVPAGVLLYLYKRKNTLVPSLLAFCRFQGRNTGVSLLFVEVYDML